MFSKVNEALAILADTNRLRCKSSSFLAFCSSRFFIFRSVLFKLWSWRFVSSMKLAVVAKLAARFALSLKLVSIAARCASTADAATESPR